MNTELLQALIHAVDSGSLTGAAQSLRTDLSTISRRLKTLEDAVRKPLLVRTPRGVRTTEAGQRFVIRAREILRQIQLAVEEANEARVGPEVLAVSVPPEVGLSLLPRVVARVAAAHPSVRFEISAEARRVGLIEGAYDASIRIGRADSDQLILKKAGDVRFVRCALSEVQPSGHIAVRGTPSALAEASRGPLRATVSTFSEAVALLSCTTWEAVVPLYSVASHLTLLKLRVLERIDTIEAQLYLAINPVRRRSKVLATLADVLGDELDILQRTDC